MLAANKPEIVRSFSTAASHLCKSFNSKPKPKADDALLKSFISSININTLNKDDTKNCLFENDTTASHKSPQVFSNLSVSHLDRKPISNEKRKHHLGSSSSTPNPIADTRCTRLLNKLGPDHALQVFAKMFRANGTSEFKARLHLYVERARDTDDPDVQIEMNYKAYQLFQSMTEMGVAIEEDVYGPFFQYLSARNMLEEFYSFVDVLKDGSPASLPRLAYYETLIYVNRNDHEKIKQLLDEYSLYDGEDRHLFQESYLLALCESDCRRELLMLLETFDVTKASSNERLSDIFKSLGRLSLQAYAQKFFLELKTSGAELATLSSYIYDYAINIPNLAVEDVDSKLKQLHSEMEMKPTSTQYEKLIRHYCKLLKVNVAIDLADEMFNVGLTAPLQCIDIMLDACMETYEFNMVHRIYSMIRRQGLEPGSETFRRLINLMVKLKDFNGAYGMLRDMVEMNIAPTISIYNTIMLGYFREKNVGGAIQVLKLMEKAAVKPDSQTFSYLISNCNSEEGIVKILYEMEQSSVKVTKYVFMALINAYAACGEFEKAKQVIFDPRITKDFDEMRSVLVSALASHGQLADALTIYKEIKQAGCSFEPKAALYLLERLQSEGQHGTVFQLQQELQDSNYFIDGCYKVVVYCVRHNHLSSAVDLLKKIRDKFVDDEVAAENIFDEVFSQFVNQEPKDMKFGLELLRAVKEEIGLRPSRNILDFLLDACVSANDLRTAFFIWKEYRVAGLPYNNLSFLRMYRTLLALGDLKSAEDILKKIPQDDAHISYVMKVFQDTYLRSALLKREKTTKKNKIQKSKKKNKAAKHDVDKNNC